MVRVLLVLLMMLDDDDDDDDDDAIRVIDSEHFVVKEEVTDSEGRAVPYLYRVPKLSTGPRALCLLIHGCAHDALDWFSKSENCPECRGDTVEVHRTWRMSKHDSTGDIERARVLATESRTPERHKV